MSLFSNEGNIFCARYSNYVRYLDAVRPIYDEGDEKYKCPQEELILCPGNEESITDPI
jgi:hypothetical protein